MESPKRILLFDLDGTLLRDDKTLFRYTLEIVSKCKEQDKSWGDSIYTDFSDFNHEALKICVEISDSNLAQKLSGHFSELDSQRFSDGDWYKFTKSGITKEKAILAVWATQYRRSKILLTP